MDKGWLARRPSDADRRRKLLALTAAGRAALDGAARRIAEDLGTRLAGADLPRALSAMETLQDSLAPAGAPEIALREPIPGDLGWLVARSGEYYAETHGFDATFEGFAAGILARFASADPARNKGFIAHRGAERVGSIFCMEGDRPDRAKLRVFWVEPEVRRAGLGQRLIDACLGFARDAGYHEIELFTLASQVEARRLYARAGFRPEQTEAQHAFGRDVVEETWRMAL